MQQSHLICIYIYTKKPCYLKHVLLLIGLFHTVLFGFLNVELFITWGLGICCSSPVMCSAQGNSEHVLIRSGLYSMNPHKRAIFKLKPAFFIFYTQRKNILCSCLLSYMWLTSSLLPSGWNLSRRFHGVAPHKFNLMHAIINA